MSSAPAAATGEIENYYLLCPRYPTAKDLFLGVCHRRSRRVFSLPILLRILYYKSYKHNNNNNIMYNV